LKPTIVKDEYQHNTLFQEYENNKEYENNNDTSSKFRTKKGSIIDIRESSNEGDITRQSREQ
jgi:hypothetical protein